MKRYRIAVLVAVTAMFGAMAMPAAQATGTEGCTPGFWKTHPQAWPDDYETTSDFYSVVLDWSEPDEPTLLKALDGGGGTTLAGAIKILARASTAAFLNAATDDADLWYPLHRDDMRVMIQNVWGDRDAMLELAAYLDSLNNLGSDNC